MLHPVTSPAPRWAASIADTGTGAYVHIPFCDRICPYCDFAVVRTRQQAIERYCAALQTEIERAAKPAGGIATVYFGGGTPSALPAARIESLMERLCARFAIDPGTIEVTLEANPSRGLSDLDRWRDAGINRLSVGVQSFDDVELHRLGRDHSAAQATAFLDAARAAGFENVSLDLIAGAPGQTRSSFEASLHAAVASPVTHVSVYGLTIETGTPYASWYARNPLDFPDEELVADQLETADAILNDAGFAHYEISNFALPGYESAHNIGYWRQRDCLAFGMSAAGYESGLRYANQRDFEGYCAAMETGRPVRAYEERLSIERRIGEASMLALRTDEGIVDADFARRFGIDSASVFRAARKKCSAAGLLEDDGARARLTGRGRLLANSVCAEFLSPDLSRNEPT
ncbi:MAG TPA: radical SAM family heme chaperone HemW [Candidatus Eremiobacteraceae bacterium]